MEKTHDMHRNQIADEELDQISGGRNLWDVFTAEFNDRFGKPKAQKLPLEEADTSSLLDARTLEMRATDHEKQENFPKVIKL